MDKPLQICPLMRGAGPAWLSLMNSSLQDCPGIEPLIDLDYLRLWDGDRARASLVLGADCDGQLLGAISLTFGRRRGRLRDLVVRPHARRRGIGTALVETAVDRFRERDLSLVEAQDWDVPPYNPGGVGVLPAYRRQRIGSRLVADALLLLRKRGMRQVTVWTFSYLDSPAPAVVLYRRTGATVARRCLGWERTS